MKIFEFEPRNDSLKEQAFRTYQNLRIGLCVIGALIPIFIWGSELIAFGTWAPKESISAYYHGGHPLSRDLFVGNLFVVGVFLLLYRGYSARENIVLDVGGIALTFVAIFPTRPENYDPDIHNKLIERVAYWEMEVAGLSFTVHGISAVVFFASIAYVAIFLAQETLKETGKHQLKLVYRWLGALMVLAPLVAWLLGGGIKVFLVEVAGIYVFAAFWAVKTWEFRGSGGGVEAKLLRCESGKHK